MSDALWLHGPWSTFFVGAVLLASLLAVREGRRRGQPAGASLALVCAILVGAIAGAMLLDFDGVRHEGERTLLGGLIGGFVLALVFARWLRLRVGDMADALPGPTLVGMAVGRIGCFLAGCCWGRVTELPWSVTYAPGSHAWTSQLEAGLIPADGAALAVHPVQLYEATGDMVLLALLPWFRRRVHARGSVLVTAWLAYTGLRFALEFLRGGRDPIAGLNPVQWSLVVLVVVLGVVLYWREVGTGQSPARAAATSERARRSARGMSGRVAAEARVALALTLPAVALFAGGAWLSPPETAVLFAAALGATGFVALSSVTRWTTSAATPRTFGLAMIVLVAASVQSAAQRQGFSVGANMTRGTYRDLLGVVTSQTDCGTTSRDVYGDREFDAVGASVDYTHPVGDETTVTVRGTAFTGSDRATRTDPGFRPLPDQSFQGFGLEASIDTEYVGLSAGVTFGSLIEAGAERGAAPSLALRLGPTRQFFVEHRIRPTAGIATPVPGDDEVSSVGSGFGGDDARLRVGAGSSYWFADLSYRHPGSGIGIAAGVGLPTFGEGPSQPTVFHVGLSKRFGGR